MTPENVYALQPLVGHSDKPAFERGDELQRHYTPEQLEWLIEHGQASRERPADVTPVYALVRLHYHVHTFERGDRIDGVMPTPIVAGCIANGEASYTEPKDPA